LEPLVNETEKKNEFSRGWRTLVASSLGNAAGLSGLPFYTFGVFVVPLATAFGWTRGEASGAASSLILGTAITAPLVGFLIDRIGTRRVALTSLALLALGYALLTQLTGSVALFYAAWLAMSLVGGGTTPVVWTRAVTIWFDRSRGLALGLTLAGSGLASIFGPLYCTALIERFGWQAGYLGVGAIIAFLAIPAVALLFKEYPQTKTQSATATPDLPGLDFQQAIRTPAYWRIAISFLFISAAITALLINIVPLLIDRGLTSVEAAQMASSMGIAVLVGRVVVGMLLDRFAAPRVTLILLSTTAVGCLLLVSPTTPTWLLLVSVVSLGFAAAAEVDLVAFLVSRYFGLKAYGRIYGSQLTTFYLGAAIGPALIGIAYDRFGGYTHGLYVVAGILIAGAIAIGTLGAPPREFTSESAPRDSQETGRTLVEEQRA
jgi:MFS family permease